MGLVSFRVLKGWGGGSGDLFCRLGALMEVMEHFFPGSEYRYVPGDLILAHVDEEEARYILSELGILDPYKVDDDSFDDGAHVIQFFADAERKNRTNQRILEVIEQIRESLAANPDRPVRFEWHGQLTYTVRHLLPEEKQSSKANNEWFGTGRLFSVAEDCRPKFGAPDELHVCIHCRRDNIAIHRTSSGQYFDVFQYHRENLALHPTHQQILDAIDDPYIRALTERHLRSRKRTLLTTEHARHLIEGLPRFFPDRKLTFTVISDGFGHHANFNGIPVEIVDFEEQEEDMRALANDPSVKDVILKGDPQALERTIDVLVGASFVISATNDSFNILSRMADVPTIGLVTQARIGDEALNVVSNTVDLVRVGRMLQREGLLDRVGV